jgi:cation diffusion facilitator family transporter
MPNDSTGPDSADPESTGDQPPAGMTGHVRPSGRTGRADHPSESSGRSADKTRGAREATRRTVIVAGVTNLIVGIAKLVAGILTGSSAMLAEAAHSAADTLDQAFLLASVRRGGRPADAGHPFGYGQDRYFWSLLAAFGIFIAGAGFSVFEGLLAISKPAGDQDVVVAYAVLGLSFIAEGISLTRAVSQLRGEARGKNIELLTHVKTSPDTTVKTALFEDSAAMAGLLLATVGLVLRQVTGSSVYDGSASIAIGVLLVVVAVKLGMDSRDLLIGKSAGPKQLELIRTEIEQTPGVDGLVELLTMHLGPDHLIVAARVAFSDNITADRAEDLAGDIDRRLGERLPEVPHVFIDPTQT